MFLGIRKKYWLYLAASMLLIGAMSFVHLSPVFALRSVKTTGPHADAIKEHVLKGLDGNDNIFKIKKYDLLREIVASEKIGRASLDFILPNSACIKVNQFEPVALIPGTQLYGIDASSRIIPFDSDWEKLDLPILTGLEAIRLFEIPKDSRIMQVIAGLDNLQCENINLSRQIAEIDFSDRVYLQIYLTTCDSRFLASADGFAAQLAKLEVISAGSEWSDGQCYNLLYKNIILKESL